MLKNEKPKKLIMRQKLSTLTLVILLFFSVAVGTIAVKPKPAQAFLGLNITLGDIPARISEIFQKINKYTGDILWSLAKSALNKAIDSYVQTYAYEAALKAATGSPGQKPLLYGKKPGKGIEDVMGGVAGDYLDTLSKDVFGVSLCEPFNPNIQLKIGIEVAKSEKPKKATCSLSQMSKSGIFSGKGSLSFNGMNVNSKSFKNLGIKDVVGFSGYFDSSQNEIGAVTQAQRDLAKAKAKAGEAEKLERLIGKGYKAKLNVTETDVKIPAVDVAKTKADAQEAVLTTQVPSKESFCASDNDFCKATLQILSRGISTFSKTFIGAGLEKLFKEGAVPPSTKPSDFQSVAVKTGLSAAREYFKDLRDFKPLYIESDVDVTATLASCPANKDAKAWSNCRISRGTQNAINAQLTLREAIEVKKEINGSAIFGYDAATGEYPSFDKGFPYSSLVVLRKYRIVPVGWELAAQYIKDAMQPGDHGGNQTWTIQQVMECYEDPANPNNNRYPATTSDGISCRIDPSLDCEGVDADNSGCVNPFYHLVNPDWVLKTPETKCYQEGPGPQVILEQSIETPIANNPFVSNLDSAVVKYETKRIIARADYCADERGCIQEDKNGKCEYWGYCTKEKPIWRFTADSCPAEFNTCRALTKTQGAYQKLVNNTKENEVGFLTNTLEKCELSDVGCAWYSTYYDKATDTWEGNSDIGGAIGQADRIYLDGDATPCSPKDDGCSLFYKAFDNSEPIASKDALVDLMNKVDKGDVSNYNNSNLTVATYIKKAPDYYNCEYGSASPAKECEKYATYCSEKELGCMNYDPVNGDPKVPGKITPNDQCNQECIGFATFTYTPSWFEDAEDDSIINNSGNIPVSLIPSTGQQCNQSGCEAFTNLDKVAAGGEGVEYYTRIRQCVTPGTAGTKTYFTWEGSDTNGYQLKKWIMLEGSAGAPCTGITPGSPTSCSATVACTDTTDPSCRSFFDENGNTYNADINDVIYSSEDCKPLRRTESGTVYYGDTSLSQQCNVENVGCREYKGAGANNVRVLYTDTFEAEDADSLDSIGLTFDWQGGLLSSEALDVNGHSLEFDSSDTTSVYKDVSASVKEGKFYTFSFLAKGTEISFYFYNGSDLINIGSKNLGNEWQYYTLGPTLLDHRVTAGEIMSISGEGFVDSIIVKESTNSNLLIKNSWDTELANSCAINNDFNCELYKPDEGDNIALKSFTTLCEDKFLGCIAVIDTQNSDRVSNDGSSPIREKTWNTYNDTASDPTTYLDNITVPADELVYIVDDKDKYCGAESKGCQLVGEPDFDRQVDEQANFKIDNCVAGNDDCQQPIITSFGRTAFINDPDRYDNILCGSEKLFCSLYTTEDGASYSYIDPGTRVAEYFSTTIDGNAPGWYQKGTTTTVDTTYDVYGFDPLNPNQPLSSDDSQYDGWVGLCEPQYNSCSQLIDVEAKEGDGVYYLLQSQLADQGIAPCSQEGIVDRDAGCRLFADTANFSTTKQLYTDQAYDPNLSSDGFAPVVNPDDDTQNSANILVKVQPDRVCKEFLSCTSSLTLDNNQESICLGIGLCSKLDASGKCIDGGTEILGKNKKATQQSIDNSQPSSDINYLSNINLAQWSVGMSKLGAAWPFGSVVGLYPYHLMQEIGAPLTLPNSNFEDRNNFGQVYSSWPDTDITGQRDMQNNVRIVSESSGIFPYEGNNMLEMEMDEQNPKEAAFIISAELPSSPGMETALAFYVNFDTLRQQKENKCVAGNRDKIGDSCVTDEECGVGHTVCTEYTVVDSGNSGFFCKKPEANSTIYNSCIDDSGCSNGAGTCGEFVCTGDYNTKCDPNFGLGSANNNSACSGVGYCNYVGGTPPGSQVNSSCTAGDAAKIGNACTTNKDCAVTSPSCEPVGSILQVNILKSDTLSSYLVDGPIDVVVTGTGWQQVTIPFVVPADSSDNDVFRIELRAENKIDINGNVNSPAVGSVMIDGLEIRSGLKTGPNVVVAPSCRLYPRTDGLDTDALACDYVDRGNISGNTLTTYKGWRGYCAEAVPDKPGVCLNWWPVDVVQGDVNLFGSGQVADINYPNDLYYCAQSTGDLSNKPNSVLSCTGSITCNTLTDWQNYSTCRKDPYDGVIDGDVDCSAIYDNNSCPNDARCKLEDSAIGNPTTYTYKTENRSVCVETQVSASLDINSSVIYKSQIENIAMVWDTKNACNYCGCHWPQGGKKYLLKPQRDNEYSWVAAGRFDGNKDGFDVEAVFDPDTKKLLRFDYSIFDNSSKKGGGLFHFEVHLRDVCQTVVRVNTSYGATTPWFNRFQQSTKQDPDPALFYGDPGKDKLPFGAISPPSNDFEPSTDNEENPWLGVPSYGIAPGVTTACSGDLTSQECARAGSAYSCEGDCGINRVCISGATEDLGKSCKAHDDCLGDDPDPRIKGLCGGYFGNAKQLSGENNIPYAFDVGISRLRQLFAKSYGIYGWDYEQERYVKCDSFADPATQPASCFWPVDKVTDSQGNVVNLFKDSVLPKTWPFRSNAVQSVVVDKYDITGCGSPNYEYNDTSICRNFDATGKAPEVNNFIVDNKSNEDIIKGSGEFITLQFYPSVNKNRQPLKALKVDWGDGTYLKPNQDLTNLAGQGLPINNYLFVHQYICGPNSSNTYNVNDPANSGLPRCGDVDSNGNKFSTNCWDDVNNKCVFVPKVQLKDNWGWCSPDRRLSIDKNVNIIPNTLSYSYTEINNGIYKCNLDQGWTDYTNVIMVSQGALSSGSCTLEFQDPDNTIRAPETTRLDWKYASSYYNHKLSSVDGNSDYTPNPADFGNTLGGVTVESRNDWVLRTETYILSMTDLDGSEIQCSDTVTIQPTIPSCTLTPVDNSIAEGSTTADFNWTANYATQISDGEIFYPANPPQGNGTMTFSINTNTSPVTVTATASNDYGDSGVCSATVEVKPNSPGNFTAASVGSSVTLTWTDLSNIETGYRIQRSTGNGSWEEVAVLGSNIESYSDTLTSAYFEQTIGNCDEQCNNFIIYNNQDSVPIVYNTPSLTERIKALFKNIFSVEEAQAIPACFPDVASCSQYSACNCSTNTAICGDANPVSCNNTGSNCSYTPTDATQCSSGYVQTSQNRDCGGVSYVAQNDCTRVFYRISALNNSISSDYVSVDISN